MAYWFNTRTNSVETDENRGRDEEVMGPYETEDAARNAYGSAHARTEAWDEAERREKLAEGDDPDEPGLLG